MSTIAMNQTRESPFRGAWLILRFNWPQYATAAVAVSLLTTIALALPLPPWGTIAALSPAALVAWWAVASLLVSHWVYDRSAVSDWRILHHVLPTPPRRWVHMHAGLDNATDDLRRLFPRAHGQVLDIYSDEEMSEPSIHRARAAAGPRAPATPADYRRLPTADGWADAVFLPFAAHELRTHEARATLLRECARILAPNGVAVVAEHLRDPWGFVAFGPGFTHFHSRRTWLAAAEAAGLSLGGETRCTPFARLFVLRRSR